MLSINKITKTYGKVTALDGFSASFGNGVYGLLGPNGSGKTTLMNVLTGNLKPDAGELIFNGKALNNLPREYRSQIGYMPQCCEPYPDFSAVDFLDYISVLKGAKKGTERERINDLLELFELYDVANRPIKSYSGGMKRRLMLVQAFLGNPKLVILDEPTAGLDPSQRSTVKSFIAENSKDKTIIVSTHIISDIDSICNGIIFIKNGVNVLDGTPDDILSSKPINVWTCSILPEELPEVKRLYQVVSMKNTGNEFRVRIISDKIPKADAVNVPAELEDMYIYLFGDRYVNDKV